MSVRTQKLRKWSSFGHRFGHRSELPFTFGFLRCVHFVHDTSISIVNCWHTTFECFWRLHFVPILTCWMNVFKFKNLAHMCMKSHRFLCNPYRSWEFHDSIKYQCPGVTVPTGRRFWRALTWSQIITCSPKICVFCTSSWVNNMVWGSNNHQVAKVCRKKCGIFYMTHFLFKNAPLFCYKNLSWNQSVCWHQLIQFTLGVKGNISLFANQMPISCTSTINVHPWGMAMCFAILSQANS